MGTYSRARSWRKGCDVARTSANLHATSFEPEKYTCLRLTSFGRAIANIAAHTQSAFALRA